MSDPRSDYAPGDKCPHGSMWCPECDGATDVPGDKPRLLDLFCKQGGATRGYQMAGFHVTGVDIEPQPLYCGDRFYEGDAMEWLADPDRLAEFDAIHASPPCQGYSAMGRAVDLSHYPRLIEPVRELLLASGKPFVIENVEGAPLRDAITLCGTKVGVPVRRHRLFELHPARFLLLAPCSCKNGVIEGRLIGHREGGKVAPGRTRPPSWTLAQRRVAMGVPWMSAAGVREAIPPAYTLLIGSLLMEDRELAAS